MSSNLDQLLAQCLSAIRNKSDPEASLRRILEEYDEIRDRELFTLIKEVKKIAHAAEELIKRHG